ncbi:PRC-barrel domain-containing protein [Deinococcus multiflagellatus]|uniref:PRC-barrel domain-containing protein n=1 Tax=Deinococcus multiflagellatus TaxID=1656887 RepID=A0ABW1ZIZ9_9DEIO|nr:PRC-barrel domain-containing protein [Deinococcus multiflagellatus]MBZ9714347.1 PRC-barrel domain-containing protein [Deinococcus multiflagellatus]
MIKGKDLLGRPIVAVGSGERIDRVHDVIFDHQANQVLGLLVDEGGWFSAAKVVPFERIRSIGEDAIMIGTPDDVTTTREDGRLKDALDSKVSLVGLTLLTTDGQNLGKIADVFFDDHTGRVEGYEATGGLFADLSSGRTFVPAPEQVQIGVDTALVPPAVAQAMQEQEDGGLKGALASAGQSIKGAYENIADATKERQKEFVVGKTAGGDITDEDGRLLVAKGETITEAHAEAADAAGKLTALATAATGGVLADAYGSARERVQDTYEDVKNATAERQKAYVVGKTARSEISTDAGEVIVPAGAVITSHQADRAEQTGRLAALTAAATGGAIQEGVQSYRERQQVDPNSVEAAIGRRVKTDVRAPGGSIVAATGQIVTPAIADRARHVGVESALIAATTGSAVHAAAAPASSGLASVTESAGSLIDRAKAWLGDKREQAEGALEQRQQDALEQRVRDALGRPVTRVILAPDDSIILNIGEIVTHKAVQAARDGDVLDILVSSVSKDEPHLDPLASRPEAHGEAALETQPEPAVPGQTAQTQPTQTQATQPQTDPNRSERPL